MTEDSIIKNVKRILFFFKEDKMPDIIDYSEKGLLDLYSRILDVNGASVSGLSVLYLTGSDYKEMLWFCRSHCDDFMDSENSFRFSFYGYNWTVLNK